MIINIMDILYDKPAGITIIGALAGATVLSKKGEILSEDVEDDDEISHVIAAIKSSAEAASLANKRHGEIVLQIKALEMREQAIHRELVTQQTLVVNLTGKLSGSEEALKKANEDLLKCKQKVTESNKKLEKLAELEVLVEKQNGEIKEATAAALNKAKIAAKKHEVSKSLINTLKEESKKYSKMTRQEKLMGKNAKEEAANKIYDLEVKHKKEFDAKVEEIDDLRAKFKGLEISLKKQEARTSLRETEKNQLNAGLIKAKKSIKKQTVKISSLQSTIAMKDKEIKQEAIELEKTKATAKSDIDEANKRATDAFASATIAEKQQKNMKAKYDSAKDAMRQMQKDGTQACINPEPQNQPVLAGKAKEQTEYLGYWIQGMGEALYHPHDFKKVDGAWKDVTTFEKLKIFAREEGRFNGIRRELKKMEKNKKGNITRQNENAALLKNQAEKAQKGRESKYLVSSDTMWAKLYGKTLTFQKDQGELKKIYNEMTIVGNKAARKGAEPLSTSLLHNIQLKF